MRDVRHILLPTDFSENAMVAFPAAVSLARRFDATLHLLHVVPIPRAAYQVLGDENFPAQGEGVQRHCERQLRDLVAEFNDVQTEIHVADGDAADEVVNFVSKQRVDLVTISTKGQTGLKRFMLGSTAEKVVRTAPCPVLVTRPRPSSWDTFAKILVPTDFSELSALAIDEAVELARSYSTQILLVHVLEAMNTPSVRVLKGSGILDLEEQTRKGVQARLEGIQQERVPAPVVSSIQIPEGVPSATIADVAKRQNVDLVVIATHGRKGLARFVLGSTAERVVRISPCSVLVGTPVESLLLAQNLDRHNIEGPRSPDLIIATCIEPSVDLHIPSGRAYVIRTAGVNLKGESLFQFVYLTAKLGIRHVALIAHDACAMVGLSGQREEVVERLSERPGFDASSAGAFFDRHSNFWDVPDAVSVVCNQSREIRRRCGDDVIVAPLFYTASEGCLLQIMENPGERRPPHDK